MKRTNAQSVGDIINQVLRQERLDVRLDEQRALAMWPELVGPGINRYTTARSVKDGVLTFTISSAPLRNQLMLSRSSLITRINEALGREVIKEIIFR
ncbi:MAG: DUF721 domain-containing protein [Bacteroidales bacterium]|nr:DUF721 domain-containing protein [Muribaculaceae bacterium]MDO4971742.1 DUF721 domain-containing protein [Bacteroidales bacterium]